MIHVKVFPGIFLMELVCCNRENLIEILKEHIHIGQLEPSIVVDTY